MHKILFQKDHVPEHLLGRDFLWSLKRPLNPCSLGSGWLLKQAFSLVPRPIPQRSPAPISLTWDWTPTRNKIFWLYDESFYSTKLVRLKWLAIGLVGFFFVWWLFWHRLLHSVHKNATTERRAWSTTHIKRRPLRVCITNWLLKTKRSFFYIIPFLREHQKNQAHVREMFRFFCPLLEVKLLLLLREHKMYIIPSRRGSDIFHWPSFAFVFSAFS